MPTPERRSRRERNGDASPAKGKGITAAQLPRARSRQDQNAGETALGRLTEYLGEPVDIASIVFFRIAFGALLLVEVVRYFAFGWVRVFYVESPFHFTYYGFGWVHPLPGVGMYLVFAALGVLAVCILAGFHYRMASRLFFVGFTYVFLIDQAYYLNHFYLISLVSFLMMFVPANRAFSVDAKRQPGIRSDTVPRWSLWLLRAQFAIVYFFAAVAKMDRDWLRGSPMRWMLARRASLPIVGSAFHDQRVVLAFAFGGLLFDLLIVPLVMWRRTRVPALLLALFFHSMNQYLFNIGIFPWFAMAGTLLFLPPDWPRSLLARFLNSASSVPRHAVGTDRRRRETSVPFSRPAAFVLAAYFVLQILLPLRHFLYPGYVNWTDEGQLFAWRMMLREKQGSGRFIATDRYSGRRMEINPGRDLNRVQVGTMWIQPDMILEYAHFVADRLRDEGWGVVEVRAHVVAALNGRNPQTFIDPEVDLCAQKRSLAHARWILPLTEPLPPFDEPASTQAPIARTSATRRF